MHDEIEKSKNKLLRKLLPMHLFENKDKENALNNKFKSEVVPVLLEQQFQDVNYYDDQRIGIDSKCDVAKYYRCTSGVDNPNLITGYRNGIPFRAGQVTIRTSGVENSQTGSSSTELAFSGVLVVLQNKFSVEKPVTLAQKAQNTRTLKGAFQKIKNSVHSRSDLETEFDKKYYVKTKGGSTSFLTPELMTKLLDIREKVYYGYTIFFEEDKIYITHARYCTDNFGIAFYFEDTFEKKFNRVNGAIKAIGDIVDWASALVE